MAFNMDEMLSELLEAKKKGSKKTQTPLEVAQEAYRKYADVLDKLVAKGEMSKEERQTSLRDFARTTLRKNNLPNDTKLSLDTEMPETDVETSTDTPDVSAPTDEPVVTSGPEKDDTIPEPTVSPATRDRLKTLAGIEPTPVEEPKVEPVVPKVEPKTEPTVPQTKRVKPVKISPTSQTSKATSTAPKVEPVTPETPKVEPKATEPTEPLKTPAGGVPDTSGQAKTEPTKTTEPEKTTEPKKAEEPKPVDTSTTSGDAMTADKLRKMSRADRETYFASLGFKPQGGVGGFFNNLRNAWRGAKAGYKGQSTVDLAPRKYVGTFEESILEMMDELHKIEYQLKQESISEELKGKQKNIDVAPPFGQITGADFKQLRARRNTLRELLVKEMVREELHKHNTSLAELNSNQRAALTNHINERSKKLWELLAEMPIEEQHTSEVGVTTMEEQYTLEEWIGMLEEAGYSLEEGNKENKAAKTSWETDGGRWSKVTNRRDNRWGRPDADRNILDRHGIEKDPIIKAANPDEYERKKEAALQRSGRRLALTRQGFGVPALPESYTLEEWIGKLEEAVVIEPQGDLAKLIAKLKQGKPTNPDRHARVMKKPEVPTKTNEQDVEEGKLSRLAAGLGLGAAAMMGGAKDAGAQSATPAQAPTTQVSMAPNDSVVSRTIGRDLNRQTIAQAQNRADLKNRNISPHKTSNHGFGVDKLIQNPDGTFTVTTDYREQPRQATGAPQMEEQYTLEEWMSMLEEAGYDVSEYSLWRPKESNAKSTGVVKEPKKEKEAPKEPVRKKSVNELSPETLASYNAKATKDLETHNNIMQRDSSNFERKARNRHKGIQAARGVLRAQGMPTEPKVEESTISENTVARLQGLAGIKPLNG